jgi:hypothetical protein
MGSRAETETMRRFQTVGGNFKLCLHMQRVRPRLEGGDGGDGGGAAGGLARGAHAVAVQVAFVKAKAWNRFFITL